MILDRALRICPYSTRVLINTLIVGEKKEAFIFVTTVQVHYQAS